MSDTRLEIELKFRQMMQQKSGEERLIMGCSMFDTAKKIAESSIRNENPQIQEEELKTQIFKRFYKNDFTSQERQRIIKHFFVSHHSR